MIKYSIIKNDIYLLSVIVKHISMYFVHSILWAVITVIPYLAMAEELSLSRLPFRVLLPAPMPSVSLERLWIVQVPSPLAAVYTSMRYIYWYILFTSLIYIYIIFCLYIILCVCICMYIYIYICVYTILCTCIYIYIYTHVWYYVYAILCIKIILCVCTYIHI